MENEILQPNSVIEHNIKIRDLEIVRTEYLGDNYREFIRLLLIKLSEDN